MNLAAVIRRQEASDRPAVRDVIVRALEQPVVADPTEAVQAALVGAAGLSDVADIRGRPVGHVPPVCAEQFWVFYCVGLRESNV